MVQRRSVTNDISFSICKFSVSDLVVLRDNPFEVYIEVSFVLSFSSGKTPNIQIDHAANFPKNVIFPQPGLPEGVLTFSIKECVRVARPSGSPAVAGRFPRPIWAGFPTSKIQIPNSKNQTIPKFKIQNLKCKVQNQKYEIQNPKSKTHNP